MHQKYFLPIGSFGIMSVAVVQLYSNQSSSAGFESRQTRHTESHGIETIKAADDRRRMEDGTYLQPYIIMYLKAPAITAREEEDRREKQQLSLSADVPSAHGK